jgi:D-tyrosyl-tRNA(Tyr) deacylase
MRVLVQRVRHAEVEVDGKEVGSIGQGLLLFTGFGREDTPEMLPTAARKIMEMRLFSDPAGKLNLSVQDIKGSLLVVSQFTLYANCTRGRRPDFTPAAPPELAETLYNEFTAILKTGPVPVETGIFAADMQVTLANDGPVTFLLEF